MKIDTTIVLRGAVVDVRVRDRWVFIDGSAGSLQIERDCAEELAHALTRALTLAREEKES